jgi:hypothetical protein
MIVKKIQRKRMDNKRIVRRKTKRMMTIKRMKMMKN